MKRPVELGEADPRSYVRLAARLRNQILNGELAPGGAVPSITTFSERWAVLDPRIRVGRGTWCESTPTRGPPHRGYLLDGPIRGCDRTKHGGEPDPAGCHPQ